MLIQATSDIHGYLPEIVPDGDVLVIAGDLCPVDMSHAYWAQYKWMTNKFFPWLESIESVDHIIFIGGNHDFVLDPAPRRHQAPEERNPAYHKIMEAINGLPDHIHYLIDSGVSIDGTNFWGTPYVPEFFGWAFMEEDRSLYSHYEKIPEDTDVLISHGPPYGFGDIAWDIGGRTSVGSYALASTLSKRPNIAATFYGHIHGGYGIHDDIGHSKHTVDGHNMWENPINSVMFNVAMMTDDYRLRPVDIRFTDVEI